MHRTEWEKSRDRGEDPVVVKGDDPFAHHREAHVARHFFPGEAAEYAADELSAMEKARADQHMAGCARCAILVGEPAAGRYRPMMSNWPARGARLQSQPPILTGLRRPARAPGR